MLRGGRGKFLDYLFPLRCAGCRLFCKNILCAACYHILRAQEYRRCVLNGLVVKSAAPFSSDVVANVIHALKYEQIFSVAEACARLVAPLAPEYSSGAHYIPVPLHPRRWRERGYNQSELIIRALGKTPEYVLERVHYTAPQAKSNKIIRQSQLAGAFKTVAAVNQTDFYVLVDDVVTTGATITACANEIRRAGARRICAITIASA